MDHAIGAVAAHTGEEHSGEGCGQEGWEDGFHGDIDGGADVVDLRAWGEAEDAVLFEDAVEFGGGDEDFSGLEGHAIGGEQDFHRGIFLQATDEGLLDVVWHMVNEDDGGGDGAEVLEERGERADAAGGCADDGEACWSLSWGTG
ncbi:MAG: hypothetical protein RI897_786 [Verrucomicrobiota bacterium]